MTSNSKRYSTHTYSHAYVYCIMHLHSFVHRYIYLLSICIYDINKISVIFNLFVCFSFYLKIFKFTFHCQAADHSPLSNTTGKVFFSCITKTMSTLHSAGDAEFVLILTHSSKNSLKNLFSISAWNRE